MLKIGSIEIDKTPLARWGWPYLLGAAALAWVATALGIWVLAAPLWVVAVFSLFFFRDPARTPQVLETEMVSPADGVVVVVKEAEHDLLPGERLTLVSIFMSVFNCHVNRIPFGGKVARVRHVSGGFMRADLPGATHGNERCDLLLDMEGGGRMVVTQVAGAVARHIECTVLSGDVVHKGERYGMIRFGSRLDVYLPSGFRPQVQPGMKVRAGRTVIGER